jgi:hypothetical protein
MNEKLKSYLGIAIIISVLLVGFSAFSYSRTYSRMVEPGGYRSFAVTGEGKAVSVPDIATFSFGVVTEGGKDLTTLQDQNSKKINAAIAYLKEQGIKDADIKTANYSVEPRYQYSTCNYVSSSGVCPPSEIVGYTIRQEVAVKVRDFKKIGEMLSGIVAKGANSVSQLNFTIDDPTTVENEARAEAIVKAKAKAKEVAKAGGFSLGRLISINENGSAPMPYYANKSMATGIGGGDVAAASNIQVGSEEVSVSVTLSYEIN